MRRFIFVLALLFLFRGYNVSAKVVEVDKDVVAPKLGDFVNIRSGKGADKRIIGRLYDTCSAVVTEDKGDGWYKVKSGLIEGYVNKSYLLRGKELHKYLKKNISKYKLRVRFKTVTGGYQSSKLLNDDTFTYKLMGRLEEGCKFRKTPVRSKYMADIQMTVSYGKLLQDCDNLKQGSKVQIVSVDGEYASCLYKDDEYRLPLAILETYTKVEGVSNLYTGEYTGKYDIIGKVDEMYWLSVKGRNMYAREEDLSLISVPTCEADFALSVDEYFEVEEYSEDFLKLRVEEESYYIFSYDPEFSVVFDFATPVSISGDSGGSTLYKYKYKEGTEDATKKRDRLIKYALKYLGNPYLYGGEDIEHGIDCSAYARYCLRHLGINITRTTREQYTKGKEVDPDDIVPGDLIYYTRNGYTPYHVVIYIGKDMCVNASCRRLGVCVSPVKWSKLLTIRNYID